MLIFETRKKLKPQNSSEISSHNRDHTSNRDNIIENNNNNNNNNNQQIENNNEINNNINYENNNNNEVIWYNKYQPKYSTELVLHYSKIKAVREWIMKSIQNEHQDPRTKILFLCGCSGCGKSTLVQILTRELGITLLEWSNDNSEYSNKVNSNYSFETQLLPVDQYLEDSYPNKKYFSTFDDTEEFAIRSAYPSLISGSNDQQRINSRKSLPSNNTYNNHSIASNTKRIILINDPDSISSTNITQSINLLHSFRDPVVMIVSDIVGKDDCFHAIDQIIPKSYQEGFGTEIIFCPPITEKNVQKVLTKISGEEYRNLRKELSFGTLLNYDFLISLPLEEELRDISVACLGDLRHAISTLQIRMLSSVPSLSPSPSQTGSRFNINNNKSDNKSVDKNKNKINKLLNKNNVHNSSFNVNNDKNNNIEDFDSEIQKKGRDKSFSMLHGIGKLLYSRLDNYQSKLPFDTDEVLRSSDLSLDLSLAFLQWNSYAIFDGQQDSNLDPLTRLEKSCALFSDCQLLLDRQYTTDQFFDRTNSSNDSFPTISPSFPAEYVISISSRISSVTSINSLTPPSITTTTTPTNLIDLTDSIESTNIPEIDDLWEDSPPKNKQTRKKQKHIDEQNLITNKQKGSRGYSGLIYVRRPKTLDIRPITTSLRSEILSLRDSMSSITGSLNANSEIILSLLPYQRYFYSVRSEIHWNEEVKSSLEKIFCGQYKKLNYEQEEKLEDDENYSIENKKLHKYSEREIVNKNIDVIDSQNMEEIDTFSD